MKIEELKRVRSLLRDASLEDLIAVRELLEARLGVACQTPKPVGAPKQSKLSYGEIRQRRAKGETLESIGRAAGLSRQRISVICKDLT